MSIDQISQTLVDTPLVGLEDVQRAAFFVFFESMNNALAQIQDYWTARDQVFNQRTGQTIPATELETIPTTNFHEGHKPSLVLGKPDDYPNLAVFGTRADPSPESDRFDQMESWYDTLLVEIMVKATDEDTCNRRAHRTAEAVVLCIRRNPTLGGAVTNLLTAPTLSLTDVFAVRSESQGGGYGGQSGDGQRYIWQGAAINIRVPKDSVIPSDGSSTFSRSSQTDYSQFIDQG